MDKKILIIAVVLVVVVAAVGAAFALSSGDDDDSTITEGVVYDGNGGKTPKGDSTFELTSTTVSENMFVLEGKEFSGWNTKADGTGKTYMPGDDLHYDSGKTVRLYAQWEDPKFYITGFNSNLPTGMTIIINGTQVTPLSALMMPVYETGNMMKIMINGHGTDWTYTSDGVYKYNYNGDAYEFTVKITGASGLIYQIGDESLDIGFLADGNVSINIMNLHARS